MTAVNAADMTTNRSFLDVWVITLGHTMTHWYPATFYLLLPLIGNELGLNYSEIGAILTRQYLVGAVSNVPGGLVVDMIGRKTLLMALSRAAPAVRRGSVSTPYNAPYSLVYKLVCSPAEVAAREQLARIDQFDRFLTTVNAYDERLAIGAFECLNCADSHRIVRRQHASMCGNDCIRFSMTYRAFSR